ncbi:MAG: carbon-nitrogen hydrolase family protein [Bacteroidota bacterium]
MSGSTPEDLRTAVVQMNSQPDPEANLRQLRGLIKQAADAKADWVLLPENFIHYGNEGQKRKRAAELRAMVESEIAILAEQHQLWILGGGYPVPTRQAEQGDLPKIFNRAALWNPQGQLVTHYDKVHLFDVQVEGDQTYQESRYVQPGQVQPVNYPLTESFTLGFSICYDLRFPEWYRALVDADANVLCVPAAFTARTGEAHWKSLLRARAIENTSYVVAAAQYGSHGSGMQTFGHAMIIDPWGDIMAEADEDSDQVLVAELEVERLKAVRANLPTLKHRRL